MYFVTFCSACHQGCGVLAAAQTVVPLRWIAAPLSGGSQ